MTLTSVLMILCALVSLATLYHVFSSIYQDVTTIKPTDKPVSADPYAPRYFYDDLIVPTRNGVKVYPVKR